MGKASRHAANSEAHGKDTASMAQRHEPLDSMCSRLAQKTSTYRDATPTHAKLITADG
jgi:hypothetical protein